MAGDSPDSMSFTGEIPIVPLFLETSAVFIRAGGMETLAPDTPLQDRCIQQIFYGSRITPRGLMKTTFSFLLPSLLVPACAHVPPHATDSARDVAPMELASGNADRRNPAAVVQRDYVQCGYYHLGEIRSICVGATS